MKVALHVDYGLSRRIQWVYRFSIKLVRNISHSREGVDPHQYLKIEECMCTVMQTEDSTMCLEETPLALQQHKASVGGENSPEKV